MTLIETTPALYPEIEPYEHGLLEVGGGHRLYYELTLRTCRFSPPPPPPRFARRGFADPL